MDVTVMELEECGRLSRCFHIIGPETIHYRDVVNFRFVNPANNTEAHRLHLQLPFNWTSETLLPGQNQTLHFEATNTIAWDCEIHGTGSFIHLQSTEIPDVGGPPATDPDPTPYMIFWFVFVVFAVIGIVASVRWVISKVWR